MVTSSSDGIIGFFWIKLNRVSACSMTGLYLEMLLFSERLLKKYFTILSSKEWNVTTPKIPPFFKTLAAFISPKINSLISLFTNILRA